MSHRRILLVFFLLAADTHAKPLSQERTRLVVTSRGAYRVPAGEHNPNGGVPSAAEPIVKPPARLVVPDADSDPSSGTTTSVMPIATPYFQAQLVHAWPHDASAFTEGFGFAAFPVMFESTGLFAADTTMSSSSSAWASGSASSVRLTNFHTGRILLHRELDARVFAEGSCILDGVLVVVSYSSNAVLLFDAKTLEPLPHGGRDGAAPRFPPQGPLSAWGITTDGVRFFVSDGTADIHVLSKTFEHLDTITVHDGDVLVRDLNELEFVEGLIYANILGKHCLVKILPETGDVVGIVHVDSQKLFPQNPNELSNVLNGIAYDSARKLLVVTGKLWPHAFQIREVPVQATDGLKQTCYSTRMIDYRHSVLGLQNALPLIPMPTAKGVRAQASLRRGGGA